MQRFVMGLTGMVIVSCGLLLVRGIELSTPTRASIPRVSLAEIEASPDARVEEALNRYRSNQCRHWRACVLKH